MSDISKIEIVETQSAAGFPFAVHFSGHESPWTLYAASEVTTSVYFVHKSMQINNQWYSNIDISIALVLLNQIAFP